MTHDWCELVEEWMSSIINLISSNPSKPKPIPNVLQFLVIGKLLR